MAVQGRRSGRCAAGCPRLNSVRTAHDLDLVDEATLGGIPTSVPDVVDDRWTLRNRTTNPGRVGSLNDALITWNTNETR